MRRRRASRFPVELDARVRELGSEGVEASDWTISDDDVAYAEELDYRNYDVERRRISGSLTLGTNASIIASGAGASAHGDGTSGVSTDVGNARNTPPHLHFGIYRRGYGPLDPFPYVRAPDPEPARPTVNLERLGDWARTARPTVQLHTGPADKAPLVRRQRTQSSAAGRLLLSY